MLRCVSVQEDLRALGRAARAPARAGSCPFFRVCLCSPVPLQVTAIVVPDVDRSTFEAYGIRRLTTHVHCWPAANALTNLILTGTDSERILRSQAVDVWRSDMSMAIPRFGYLVV